jgi:hypothetical protein
MHEQGEIGKEFREFAGGGQAVHDGHDQVEKNDTREEFLGLGDGQLAIFDVHDLPVAGILEQVAQGGSNRRIVIGNQYSGRHANARTA